MNRRKGETTERMNRWAGAVLFTTLILTTRSAADTLIPQSVEPLEQHLVFSPWTKVCQDREQGNAHQTCFTGKNGRTDSGKSFVAAVLIDPGNENEKILRVTLPLGMRRADGVWITVDQDWLRNAPYVTCVALGCIADYQANSGLIDKLKEGKNLVIEAVDGQGQLVSFVLPLLDFSKAYNGPPTYRKNLEGQ